MSNDEIINASPHRLSDDRLWALIEVLSKLSGELDTTLGIVARACIKEAMRREYRRSR